MVKRYEVECEAFWPDDDQSSWGYCEEYDIVSTVGSYVYYSDYRELCEAVLWERECASMCGLILQMNQDAIDQTHATMAAARNEVTRLISD